MRVVGDKMAINGSDLITAPWETIFSPWTDLFANYVGNGNMFYLMPLSVIAIALYVKTDRPVLVSMYMIAAAGLLSTGSIFIGAIDMIPAYIIFAGLGIAGVFIGFLIRR